MTRLRDKRDPARIFLRRLMLLALLVLAPFLFLKVYDVYQKEKDSRALRIQAESEQGELLKREAQLQEDIANLRTDRGLEEALREQYAYAEEGEGLIVIVEPSSPESEQATSTWERLMHRFLPFW